MPDVDQTKRLTRRLAPLYVAAFLQSFVLWYTVEKLFMQSIGFDATGVGLMIAVYSAAMLIIETPSGVLADRWSRRGVLMLASGFLMVATLINGISTHPFTYIFGSVFWGAYFAMYSGTYESIVYDTVYEETGSSKQFEKLFGRFRIFDSLGLVISSLLGGVLAGIFSLRFNYFATLPVTALSFVALALFKEPLLHKKSAADPIIQHVATTMRAVTRNRYLLPILLVLVFSSVITFMTFEFGQIWVIALGAPLSAFGPTTAILLSSVGLGGLVAPFIKLHRLPTVLITLGMIVGTSLGLVFSRQLIVTVLAQTILVIAVMALSVVFTRLLHDELGSKVRAGAASAVSTFGRLIIMPLGLLFGFATRSSSVFQASWLLVMCAVICSLMVLVTIKQQKQTDKLFKQN